MLWNKLHTTWTEKHDLIAHRNESVATGLGERRRVSVIMNEGRRRRRFPKIDISRLPVTSQTMKHVVQVTSCRHVLSPAGTGTTRLF